MQIAFGMHKRCFAACKAKTVDTSTARTTFTYVQKPFHMHRLPILQQTSNRIVSRANADKSTREVSTDVDDQLSNLILLVLIFYGTEKS